MRKLFDTVSPVHQVPTPTRMRILPDVRVTIPHADARPLLILFVEQRDKHFPGVVSEDADEYDERDAPVAAEPDDERHGEDSYRIE